MPRPRGGEDVLEPVFTRTKPIGTCLGFIPMEVSKEDPHDGALVPEDDLGELSIITGQGREVGMVGHYMDLEYD